MKYYYVTAGGTSAGPESMETLCAMTATGAVSLSTMIVPVGGEDWTPLARLLRFYYNDNSGATLGPVPFSEINRLHEVGALTAEAWVLEEGGTEWKPLSAVLAAGGVAVAARPAQPPAVVRTATGAYRPPAAGKTAGAAAAMDPYAAPRTSASVTRVVRRPATGGLNRLQYFLLSIGLSIVFYGALWLILGISMKSLFDSAAVDAETVGTATESLMKRNLVIMVLLYLMLLGVSVIMMVQRLRNIGWPWYYLFFILVPLLNIWFGFALVGYPPGYARHRRFDTATKAILAVMILLFIAGIALFAFMAPRLQEAVKEKAREERAAGQVQTVVAGLQQYSMQHDGQLPAQSAGLRVLVTGGILTDESVLADPWGENLLYRIPAARSQDKFDVFSKGKDLKAGTADDIGNWGTAK